MLNFNSATNLILSKTAFAATQFIRAHQCFVQIQGLYLQNILRQSYDYLTIMPDHTVRLLLFE